MKVASQNLRNASQIAKCEPLIRTLNYGVDLFCLCSCLCIYLKKLGPTYHSMKLQGQVFLGLSPLHKYERFLV